MTVHSRPTLAVSSPPAATDESAPRVALVPQVKPKILRRPAQFSSPATPLSPSHTPDLRIDTSQAMPQQAAIALPRPWQDDPRFAIALLAIIITVNVALILWLAPTTPASGIANQAALSAASASPRPQNSLATTSPEEALLFHLGEAGASVSEQ